MDADNTDKESDFNLKVHMPFTSSLRDKKIHIPTSMLYDLLIEIYTYSCSLIIDNCNNYSADS